MLLKYGLDWIKIVDFSSIAKFWACALFYVHPLAISICAYINAAFCPVRHFKMKEQDTLGFKSSAKKVEHWEWEGERNMAFMV